MQYIVLDLEWNQPINYQSAAYRHIGDKLLFEVIQIGAARMDEDFQLKDTISVPVCPTYYLNIHPRVKRMTGLNQEILGDADAFPEAMRRFIDWCGPDCVYLTWGGDDISVLKQNAEVFGVEAELPAAYDIQPLYAATVGKNGQTALKTALETLEIEADEDKPFHNAEYDAYYTAKVLQKLPDPKGVLKYSVTPRKLCHNEHRERMHVSDIVPSVQQAFLSPKLTAPACPACGHACQPETAWIPQAQGKYVALLNCVQHGKMFAKLSFVRMKDGQTGMDLHLAPSDRQTTAYAHTKLLQYQFKCKRGDYDHYDPEDIPAGRASSMPFEDA